jgi:hypothetical protein
MTDAPLSIKKEFKIISDKNNSFLVKLNADPNSGLDIDVSSVKDSPKKSFKNNFNLNYIMKNKYFSFCENLADVINILAPILEDDKNLSLIEANGIQLAIKLPHPKCPEIVFTFGKVQKDVKDSINELYELIDELKDKINSQQKEINELKNMIKVNIIDVKMKEVDNPWTEEKFNYNNLFSASYYYYTLKENGYLAVKTKNESTIHLIKSKYSLKKGKMYKLQFTVHYLGGDYHIGFGDFTQATKFPSLVNNFSNVGLTEKGLFIDGKLINKECKIEDGKVYELVIDTSKNNLSINIDKKNVGDYSFNFDNNIYALAGMRAIGSSVHIRTFEQFKD